MLFAMKMERFRKPFDEIIPEHYVICHENGTVSKSFPKYTDKDYEITSSDVTDLNQRLLNSKDFSEPWGRCLKYSIAEAISFFVTKKLRTLLILFVNIPNTLNMKQGA